MKSAGVALAALVALASLGAGVAYRTGPPPGHTGAFGEPDCGACHFDALRDDPDGAATLDAPAHYVPGGRYDLTVTVRHRALGAAGFQLSARFLEGDRKGLQAGTLEPAGPGAREEEGENGVAYVSHTSGGVTPDVTAEDGAEGVRRWTVAWTAPEAVGPVAFDLAANAANDDDSEFGDRIYLTRHTAAPTVDGASGGERH